jgi:DNA-binding SARP family transcriptional activator/DNA-binding CsgD family transcriptional regulator
MTTNVDIMVTNGDGELRITVLGPVRAWRGADEVALGPTRQRAVLAMLAVNAGRTVSRGELIEGVWGEAPPASVDGSIHTYVSGLRRALEPQRSRWSAASVLTSDPAGYALRLAPGGTDVAEFARLRDQAQRRLDGNDYRGAVHDFDAALALWQGEALSGIPGPFAERQREHLAELRLNTRERRAEAMLASGGHLELTAELAGLVREHPLRERLRESLMLALYRSGRHTEALEVFRDARRTLVEELGVEPGPALRRLHEQILAHDTALDLPDMSNTPDTPEAPEAVPLSVVPAQAAKAFKALQRDHAPSSFVGRAGEVSRLRQLVSEVLGGRGRAVWIEGDSGIGKSELLVTALADAARRGCQLAWAVADELSRRFPLQVIFESLGIDAKSPDPRRARLAAEIHDEYSTSRGWGERDPVLGAVDKLLSLVDDLCAHSPLALVIDDLQWADESSMLVWHRLCAATRQLPLLLVAATRPAPDRDQLAKLRRGVEARDGEIFDLAPLSEPDAVELLERLVGARAGPGLRELAARAAGNPLYVREMVNVLVTAEAVEVADGTADVEDPAGYGTPRSLVAAVGRRLDFLSAGTREVLRRAALLGVEFGAGDVSAVLGKRASDLLAPIEEAIAADVLVDAGSQFAFRHPLLRQALYDGIPAPMRPVLHREAAEALAAIGAPVTRVAEQLAATPTAVDPWVLAWLAEHHPAVANRAPLIAVDLLERAFAGCGAGDPRREALSTALVRVLCRLQRNPEELARQALAIAREPGNVAEMRYLLALMRYSRGDTAAAIETLGDAADDPAMPELWRTSYKQLLASLQTGRLPDHDDHDALDAAEANAQEARKRAAGDPYLLAHSFQTDWLVDSVRRRHERALRHVDAAIEAIGDDPELAKLHFDLLDNRVFTLQNLDRLAEADDTLRGASEIAARHSLPWSLQVPVAVHRYWEGRWDEALAELDAVTEDGPAITFYGLREPRVAMLLLHGVAALIAGRRDDRGKAAAHLDAAEELAPATVAERENVDFLLAAQALAAEQRGERELALSLFEPILNSAYAAMMLRHQWLPWVVRLAVDAGDTARVELALAVCEEEAAKETPPARAFAAAAWCRGLAERDPADVLVAVAHYRQVGRRLELATALEDAAVLLADAGQAEQARTAYDEAAGIFAELSARWDLRRAESRLRKLGPRAGRRPAAPRPDRGWEALSPIEVEIAKLVAAGWSNPDIAAELALPRRTVQAHVSHVLDKLDALARGDIADALERHAANR